jgi:hypothetical protein
MTAQVADIMILDGEAFRLHTTPLEGYFERIEWRPSFCRRCTANRRGYVARWELFGELLFLTGLFGMDWIVPPHLVAKLPPDPDPFEPEDDGVKSLRLPNLFPDQAPLVFAEWVTERLVVPTGPQLVYVHAGFGSLHATYRTIDVVEGCERSSRNWDGREWARETGRFWPDDEWHKNHPQALVWPERKKVEAEDDLDWRNEDSLPDRRLSYHAAQIEALRKPCGQTPTGKPSAILGDASGAPPPEFPPRGLIHRRKQ